LVLKQLNLFSYNFLQTWPHMSCTNCSRTSYVTNLQHISFSRTSYTIPRIDLLHKLLRPSKNPTQIKKSCMLPLRVCLYRANLLIYIPSKTHKAKIWRRLLQEETLLPLSHQFRTGTLFLPYTECNNSFKISGLWLFCCRNTAL